MKALTPREKEILSLYPANTRRQIAAMLGITHRTVRRHLEHIYMKYDVDNKTSAIVEGIRRGDVDLQAAYARIVHRQE